MKGQQAISVILLTGILVVTVSTIYFWGIPLIEKNKDIALQENAENFMRNLAERVKYVANNPGREQIRFDRNAEDVISSQKRNAAQDRCACL